MSPASTHLLAAFLLCLVFAQTGAAEPADPSRDDLGFSQMTGGSALPGPVPNAAFLPASGATDAHVSFAGELQIPEFGLNSSPARIHDGLLLGKDPQRFPALRLRFVTANGELLPIERGIQTAAGGNSYWDIIVDPGRVWSEPGDTGMSRASFPFVLMNRIEGESHNGVATFLYDRERVSSLVLQVVQQTAPFYVERRFSAWGSTPVRYKAGALAEREAVLEARRRERALRMPVADMAEFMRRHPGASLEGFDNPGAGDDVVVSGLLDAGVVYTAGCRTERGPFPYCDAMRHGVWSATKSLLPAVALLRLAQKYGPGVYAERIADHLRVTDHREQWSRVSFLDAANMATGIGSGSTVAEPNDINDGYLSEKSRYDDWYRAPGLKAKLDVTFRESAYPWGPGLVARYRDQDPLVLAAAMDRYIKDREGEQASLWGMLEQEVYAPIGILYLPQAMTAPSAGEPGIPLASYGMYPTVADMLRVAQLLQNRGMHEGSQILSAAGIDRFAGYTQPAGLRTGERTAAGEVLYTHYFWHVPFREGDCVANIPTMMGWGGNVVALLPNGMTAFRISRGRERWDPTGMALVAHRARSLCPEPS